MLVISASKSILRWRVAMAIECVEIQEWIEDEISKPFEEWEERQERKCKKRKWYDPRGWFCWLETYFVKVTRWVVVKVGKWAVRTVCKIVATIIGTIWDVLTGLWDVFAGIFTGNWRRSLDGLIKILLSLGNLILTLSHVFTFADTTLFIYEEYNRGKLKAYVRKLLESKYSGEELQKIKDTLHLEHGAFGYRIPMRAVRTFLDSEDPIPPDPNVPPSADDPPNLVKLHKIDKVINLYELCGFESPDQCPSGPDDGFWTRFGNRGYWNRKRYKTLKKGPHPSGGGGGEFDNPISRGELGTYLESNGKEGPKFIVLCMRDGVLNTKLRAAELKGRELGLMPQWTDDTVKITLPEHIRQKGDHMIFAMTTLSAS